jgi:hypothetical protein
MIAAASFVAVAQGNVSAGDVNITASYALTKTTLLSTEKAELKLTVVNRTPAQITLNTGSIEFLAYSGREWHSQRYCWRDCWRWFLRIEPGSTRVATIELPSCEVLSAPCTQDVIVRYEIDVNHTSQLYQITLPQYRFVADPNAAYRDVPDGRPVLIAIGYTKAAIIPNTVIIGITAAPTATFSLSSPRPPLFAEIAKMLTAAGIAITETAYEGDNLSWYIPLSGGGGYFHIPRSQGKPEPNAWRALFTVKITPEQFATINEAIRAARQRFGEQVGKITEHAVLDVGYSEYRDVWKAAEEDAQPQADRLAQVTRSGELDGAKTGVTASTVSVENYREAHYDPDAVAVFDMLPAPMSLNVDIRAQIGYVGTQPASFHVAPAVAAQAQPAFRSVRDAWPTPTLAPAAQMAVDRPELYVIGGASEQASLQAGLAPYAVALLAARVRAHALATLLGVRFGKESLFTLYTRYSSGDQAIGVATTFNGDYTQSSKRVETDPTIQFFHVTDPKVLINVPIGIPHPESTVTEDTMAQVSPSSNILRLEVEVDNTSGEPNTPDAIDVAAKLRKMQGVIDAAATTAHGFERRFEVLLPRSSRSSIPQLARFVQTAYARSQASFNLIPFVRDCSKVEDQMLAVTLRQNWLAAQKDARAARLRLRKLLLVAAAPMNSESACYPLARDPGSLPYDTIESIPNTPRAELLYTSSMMVFRTLQIGRQ